VARIAPIPKVHPNISIETDLHVRPIPITSSVAKVAESFVCRFFDEHLNSRVDQNRYVCIVNRSTFICLNKVQLLVFRSSTCAHNFVHRFSKVFDHNILLRQFLQNDFLPHVAARFLSILHERCQYVKG
jgi:hypothetical protein